MERAGLGFPAQGWTMFKLWEAHGFQPGTFPPRCFCPFPGFPVWCLLFCAAPCPGGFCVSRESPQAELNSPSCPQRIPRLLQGLQTHLISAGVEISPEVSLGDGNVWLLLPGLGLRERTKDKTVIPGQTSSHCSCQMCPALNGTGESGNESSLFSIHSLTKSSYQKQVLN